MGKRPREAVISLSDACNSRCQMCDIWQIEDNAHLPPEVLDQLPPTLRSVNLTGGEPFLRRDLPDLVKRVHARCPRARVVITTHGMMPDRILRAVGQILPFLPRLAIRISIDGAGAVHDRVRGIPGGFERCLCTLRGLKELGVRDLGIAITVVEENVGEIGRVYDVARELGVRFSIHAVHNSAFYFHKTDLAKPAPEEFGSQVRRIIARELRSAHPRRLMKAYYYRGLVRHYLQGVPREYLCHAGDLFFYVGPEATIYPCQLIESPMGNLRNEGFAEVWQGEKAREVRRQALACPVNCWMVCTTAPCIKERPWPAFRWVVRNKLRLHLGFPVQV